MIETAISRFNSLSRADPTELLRHPDEGHTAEAEPNGRP